MSDEIGEGMMQELMKLLCSLQAQVSDEYTIPLSGNFIQNRGSMVNWCPIGRSSKRDARNAFKVLDDNLKIRNKYFEILSTEIKNRNIPLTLKLGGDTSFDIYPHGWDKTYALRHFSQTDWDFWFVGDRCYPEGNDYEIFTDSRVIGHKVEKYQDTIQILNKEFM